MENLNSRQRTQVKDTVRTFTEDFGKEAAGPFVELVNKYGDELIPYVEDISRSFRRASEELYNSKESMSEQIGHWFNETASVLDDISLKVRGNEVTQLTSIIENKGRENPYTVFAASVLVGALAGRLIKSFQSNQIESNQESIHPTYLGDEMR